MSDGVRAVCSHCGAKYRLPAEAAGRSARCKKCGEKFEVPKPVAANPLEESIMDWLRDPAEAPEESVTDRPRIINMSKEEHGDGKSIVNNGPIRMKSQASK